MDSEKEKDADKFINEENAKNLNRFELKMLEDPWEKLAQKNKSYVQNKNRLDKNEKMRCKISKFPQTVR